MSISSLCLIDECNNNAKAKGLCPKHYKLQWATPEYRTWENMKTRCYNKNDPHYDEWGGRGIAIYSPWLHSFKAFLDYVGYQPTKRHTLDRIDNDGNYEPGNVRWATRSEQGFNRRLHKNNTSGHVGVTFNKKLGKWGAQIKIDGKVKYLGAFFDIDQAIAARVAAEL